MVLKVHINFKKQPRKVVFLFGRKSFVSKNSSQKSSQKTKFNLSRYEKSPWLRAFIGSGAGFEPAITSEGLGMLAFISRV